MTRFTFTRRNSGHSLPIGDIALLGKKQKSPYQQQVTRLFILFAFIVLGVQLLKDGFEPFRSPWTQPFGFQKLYHDSQPAQPPSSTLTLPTKDYEHVVRTFLSTVPHAHFRSDRAEFLHRNNKTFTSALVRITEGKYEIEWSKSKQSKKYYDEKKYDELKLIIRTVLLRNSHAFSFVNVSFLVDLTDGGSRKRPVSITFASSRTWRQWTSMIPVPLSNNINSNSSFFQPVIGWDSYIKTNIVDHWFKYPWYSKQSKAIFRGALKVCTFVLGSCNWENQSKCIKTSKWDQCARGILFKTVRSVHDLFDVAFTSWIMKPDINFHQFDGAPVAKEAIPYSDFQKYKFILNVGSNHDWSDRLRSLMFMNSVIVQHASESVQFFTPLLKPWVHYIPFSLNMTDLVSNVRYAANNDALSRAIRDEQYSFARKHLSEQAMLEYWRILLLEVAEKQKAVDEEAGIERAEPIPLSINLRHNHHFADHPPYHHHSSK